MGFYSERRNESSSSAKSTSHPLTNSNSSTSYGSRFTPIQQEEDSENSFSSAEPSRKEMEDGVVKNLE